MARNGVIVNNPDVGKWVPIVYVLSSLILGWFAFRLFTTYISTISIFNIVISILLLSITIIPLISIWEVYRIRYYLYEDKLKIPHLVFDFEIDLNRIKSVKRFEFNYGAILRIFFGFLRLGTTFKSWGHTPGAGFTIYTISNFKDGVLLSDDSWRKFLITPSNPDKFISEIEKRIK